MYLLHTLNHKKINISLNLIHDLFINKKQCAIISKSIVCLIGMINYENNIKNLKISNYNF